jgi:amidohydrolase
MGVAQLIASRRDELPGRVMLVFQPAEEGSRGAIAMIEDDVFGGRTPDAALGLHVWSEVPAGDARIGDGPVMAAADTLNVEVQGRGTHGAIPHLGTDAVVIAAQIVMALQTVISRDVDPRQPAVVTIGSIRGGTTRNVIAPSATLEGIIRTFDPATRARVHARVRAVVEGTAVALGGAATVTIGSSAPAVVNDPRVSEVVRAVAGEMLGPDHVSADQFTMGSEDMSEFLSRAPGCYFFLGAARPGAGPAAPHHSPYFDIDESILPSGVAILAGAALRLLA